MLPPVGVGISGNILTVPSSEKTMALSSALLEGADANRKTAAVETTDITLAPKG